VRTVEHPKVRAALDRLRAGSGSAIGVLTREVNEWVAQTKVTYRLDCDSMMKMWESYCELDWESDEPDEPQVAEQTAASLQSTMQAAMGPLMAKLTDLEARATALAKKKQTKDQASRLLTQIAKEKERLERLFPRQQWQGVNDPLKFFAAEWGKAQHRRMAASFSCDVSDKSFDGGRKRPDCVRARDCMILEFKPNDETAKAAGDKQLADYLPIVKGYYERHLRDGTEPDSDHGGKAIMKSFGDAGCIKGKALILDKLVETYDMCERRYRCVEN